MPKRLGWPAVTFSLASPLPYGKGHAKAHCARAPGGLALPARNMSEPRDLEAKLAELAEHLAADMASEDLKGRTLTLKLKCSNFEVGGRGTICWLVEASYPAIHASVSGSREGCQSRLLHRLFGLLTAFCC